MNKKQDCAHPDQRTFLAILALSAKEIEQGKYKDAETLFFELDEMDTVQQNSSGELKA
ncbi:hypothetical protein [Pseudomonas sp. TWP3-1]|uniref:hypothetical protein n=1 Tax=unclassified Pseudomonas TaxID=196821 RepID=UPI003CE87143